MFTLFVSPLFSVPACFRTRAALQAEILALRHQLLVLQRSSRGHKLRLSSADRVLWVWLSHLCSVDPNAQLFSGDCLKPFDGVMVTDNWCTLFECVIRSKLRAELVGIIHQNFSFME